jgi:hypothetical protein
VKTTAVALFLVSLTFSPSKAEQRSAQIRTSVTVLPFATVDVSTAPVVKVNFDADIKTDGDTVTVVDKF